MSFSNVAVVGAGTMGNGIAHVFAQHDTPVMLIDTAPDLLTKSLAVITENLDRQITKERITQDQKTDILSRITTSTKLKDAAHAELVVEAVTEDVKVKKSIFADLDSVCDQDTILASNTSSISISELGGATGRPDRVIGMHFMNPVPLMKLVEIIRGLATSDATCEAVSAATLELGKVPARVSDYPGFVSNRILMPMINEAIFCLMEGVAERDAIDTVMKLGMNHPMGPLTLADFIGLDVCLAIMEVLHRGLGDDKYRPCPLLRNMVNAGRLGRKSGVGFYTY